MSAPGAHISVTQKRHSVDVSVTVGRPPAAQKRFPLCARKGFYFRRLPPQRRELLKIRWGGGGASSGRKVGQRRSAVGLLCEPTCRVKRQPKRWLGLAPASYSTPPQPSSRRKREASCPYRLGGLGSFWIGYLFRLSSSLPSQNGAPECTVRLPMGWLSLIARCLM